MSCCFSMIRQSTRVSTINILGNFGARSPRAKVGVGHARSVHGRVEGDAREGNETRRNDKSVIRAFSTIKTQKIARRPLCLQKSTLTEGWR